MSFLFINKTLRFNIIKTRIAMNAKISVFAICVDVIIYLLLYNCMTVPISKSVPKHVPDITGHRFSPISTRSVFEGVYFILQISLTTRVGKLLLLMVNWEVASDTFIRYIFHLKEVLEIVPSIWQGSTSSITLKNNKQHQQGCCYW